MRKYIKKGLPFLFLLTVFNPLSFQGCRHSSNKNEVVLTDSLFLFAADTVKNTYNTSSGKPEIYYGLYSPSDVAAIFQRNNLDFEPSILNAPEKVSLYSTASQIALALGVYGADLSYIKIFNDPQLTTRYLQVIMDLSQKLGIPQEYLQNASVRIDSNIDNPDSLSTITSETFHHIISFLSQQDREGNAYLIITGGWIEAMYIAVEELLKTGDPEVIRNILEQKYALDFLLSSLKNHYNDPSVAYYYRMLFVLQKYFKKTRIVFDKKNFSIDHDTRVIQYAGNSLYYNDGDLEKIRNIVVSIRNIVVGE